MNIKSILNSPILQFFKKNKLIRKYGIFFLPKGKVVTTVNSVKMSLDLRETIQRGMYLGSYEPQQTSWFRECLEKGDVMVDVGANFGWFTTLAAQCVGTHGHVYAFEPSPYAYSNIESANLKNVTLVKGALGDSPGSVELNLGNSESLHSPQIVTAENPTDNKIVVPIFVLDAYEPLKKVGRIKLLKMDIEGYEPKALAGMKNLASQGRVLNVICEFNSGWLRANGSSSEDLMNMFLSMGFFVHKKTDLHRQLDHHGKHVTLQDFWFKYSESNRVNYSEGT